MFHRFGKTISIPIRGFSVSALGTPTPTSYRPRRSLLYCPLSSPKLISKCTTTDLKADTIILDLEDSVTPSMKSKAREAMVEVLNSFASNSTGSIGPNPFTECAVRINPIGSSFEEDDIAALERCAVLPNAVVLPKIQSSSDVKWLQHRLDRIVAKSSLTPMGRLHPLHLIGMIESGGGMIRMAEICEASIHLNTLIFGGDDYAADMGLTRTSHNGEIAFARQYFLLYCKAFGKQGIDIVNIDFKEGEKTKRECTEGAMMGFTGKQCVHPSQVDIVNEGFAPRKETVEWAIGIVREEAKNPHQGAFSLNGQMIDMPTIKQAKGIIERAKACGIDVEGISKK